MNKKGVIGILIAAAVIAAAVIIGVVNGGKNKVTISTDLYFFNEAETTISAETREIVYTEGEDAAESVVKALIKGPESSRRRRTLHRDVKLLGIDRSDPANAVVNFSGEFITGDNTKDILAVYSVVKSLCALDGVTSVKVIVEGGDIVTPEGTTIGYLTNEDINLPPDTNTRSSATFSADAITMNTMGRFDSPMPRRMAATIT